MWWNAIPYVTSGLALVAFVWAVFLTSWLAGLRTQRDKVKAAPTKDRVRALEIAAEYIGVDLKDIPPGQRQAIVLKQMDNKVSLQKMKIGAALVVGIIALFLVAYVIAVPVRSGEKELPEQPVAQTSRPQSLQPKPQSSPDVIVPPEPGERLDTKFGKTVATGDVSHGSMVGGSTSIITNGNASVNVIGNDNDVTPKK